MRFVLPLAVSYQEATPRGLVSFEFPAGSIEPADDSDERFVIEHRLVPAGLAKREDAAPPAPAQDAPPAPEAAPAQE